MTISEAVKQSWANPEIRAKRIAAMQKNFWKKGQPKHPNAHSYQKGELNPNWTGDAPSYTALHRRVYKVKTKTNQCSKCGKVGLTDWANISQNYIDENDFFELCRSCHYYHDKGKPKSLKPKVYKKKEKQQYAISL